jgi:hypothetical protein
MAGRWFQSSGTDAPKPRVLALPAALKDVAQALHLEHQKDETGRDLMMRMARPRRPRSDEAPGIYWFDDPERRERLGAYCRQDVETERAVYRRIPPLTADEQSLWVLDAKINDRGIYLDPRPLCSALRRGSLVGRVMLEGRAVHIHDVGADPEYTFVGGRSVARAPCSACPFCGREHPLA